MKYQVNEQFLSIQGEGVLAGTLSTFIRLQGCPVGCSWCDSGPLTESMPDRSNGQTRNTWGAGGVAMTVEEIMASVATKHVVITGGEPILYNLDELIGALRRNKNTIQIETSGYCDFKGSLLPDWITWSPKENLKWDAPERFKKKVSEVKWVVDSALQPETTVKVHHWMLEHAHGSPYFILMPEGCPPTEDNFTKAQAMLLGVPMMYQSKWRISDRLQYRLGVR